ncbi:hypothetical protein MAR_007317 [Mya arenaria]|uniref:Uncharacterized protein n=1 Tax=Mya arenaria TaxID=6604 RepID=A0ABY7DAY8_MYAAR|nr:hypothetical protein MAR_007221 [Mya arenaria]WAQ94846.1 hypothetical protein MAR_007317 [Mya arenaria]
MFKLWHVLMLAVVGAPIVSGWWTRGESGMLRNSANFNDRRSGEQKSNHVKYGALDEPSEDALAEFGGEDQDGNFFKFHTRESGGRIRNRVIVSGAIIMGEITAVDDDNKLKHVDH